MLTKRLFIGIGIALTLSVVAIALRPVPQYGEIKAPPPINVDGREITFVHTDENKDETLIIYSNSKDYYGFGSIKAYFALTNISGVGQNVKLTMPTPDGQKVNRIERYSHNVVTEHPEIRIPATTVNGSTTEEKITPAYTEVRTQWLPMGRKQFKQPSNVSRKPTANAAADMETNTVFIDAGETMYFVGSVAFSKEGEFFIEAIGDQGAYGHLDPGAFGASDDFDSYSAGDLNGGNGGSGWSGAWSGNTSYDVEASGPQTSPNRVKASTVGEITIDRSLTSSADAGDMYFAMQTSTASGSGYQGVEFYNNTTFGGAVQIIQNGVLRVSRSGGTTTLLNPVTANTWYIIHVQWVTTTTFKVRYAVWNGTSCGSYSSFTADLTFSNSVSSITKLRLDADDEGTSKVARWDTISSSDPCSSTPTAAPQVPQVMPLF